MWRFLILLIISILVVTIEMKCIDSTISSQIYTSQDTDLLKEIPIIVEFSIKCEIGMVDDELYGLIKGNMVPIARIAPQRYQISWTVPVEMATADKILIKIYDVDGYNKWSQTADEKARGSVEELNTIVINYVGVYNGPLLSCEVIALSFACLLAYFAYSFKSKVMD